MCLVKGREVLKRPALNLRRLAAKISPALQVLLSRAVPPPFCRRQTYGLTGDASAPPLGTALSEFLLGASGLRSVAIGKRPQI